MKLKDKFTPLFYHGAGLFALKNGVFGDSPLIELNEQESTLLERIGVLKPGEAQKLQVADVIEIVGGTDPRLALLESDKVP